MIAQKCDKCKEMTTHVVTQNKVTCKVCKKEYSHGTSSKSK